MFIYLTIIDKLSIYIYIYIYIYTVNMFKSVIEVSDIWSVQMFVRM